MLCGVVIKLSTSSQFVSCLFWIKSSEALVGQMERAYVFSGALFGSKPILSHFIMSLSFRSGTLMLH